MPNTLLNYFNQRFEKSKMAASSKSGPFITISRQTGCNGTGIAIDLVKALKERNKNWKYINKEILEESANKLKIDQSKIKYVFETKKKSHIDDVLSAFSSRYYKSDKVVRKTITELLQHYALEGNVILVGRAGIATTSNIKNGFHLRFTAPYEWRLSSLQKRKEFANTDVEKFIKEHDLKKLNLIQDFCGKNISEIHFDLTINCSAFTRQQMISLILQAMELKKLI
jgi:cytidylate kinase